MPVTFKRVDASAFKWCTAHAFSLQVGTVHATREGEQDHLTLRALKFQTGDFLDVAIIA